jgi:hypothetical protein
MEGIGANNRLSGAVTRLNLKDSLEFARALRANQTIAVNSRNVNGTRRSVLARR